MSGIRYSIKMLQDNQGLAKWLDEYKNYVNLI